MNSGGDDVVTRALRRRLDHHRSFDFDKAVFIEVFTRGESNLVAHHNVFLQGSATEVEISVFESKLVAHVRFVENFKGSCLCGGENTVIVDGDFDFARRHMPVYCALSSCTDYAVRRDDKFGARFESLIEYGFVRVAVESELNYARSVAEVDENQRAEVAHSRNPTESADSLADIVLCELPAVFCSSVLFL